MTKYKVSGTADPPEPITFLVQLPEGISKKDAAFVAALGLNEANEFAARMAAIGANEENNQPISKLNWHWNVESEDFVQFDWLSNCKRKKGTSVWVWPKYADRLDKFPITRRIIHVIGWFAALIGTWRVSIELNSFLGGFTVAWIATPLALVLLLIDVGVSLILFHYAIDRLNKSA